MDEAIHTDTLYNNNIKDTMTKPAGIM